MKYLVEILQEKFCLTEQDGKCSGGNTTYELLDIVEVEADEPPKKFADEWYYDRYIRTLAVQKYREVVGDDVKFVIGDIVEI